MLKEIFTGKCPVCNENCELDEPLCASCFTKAYKFENFCGICGYPLETVGKNCDKCTGKVCKGVDKVYAIYKYQDVIRRLILAIKFRYNIRSSLTLSKIIDLSSLDVNSYDAIIPIPSHFLRRFVRFFHPTDLLIKYISITYNAPIKKVLFRKRYTDFQFKLKKDERVENVKHAFGIKKDIVFERVLIVDDILTTGSTISECAKLLRKNGAKKIDCLVFAKD